jgi:hypothetical protein
MHSLQSLESTVQHPGVKQAACQQAWGLMCGELHDRRERQWVRDDLTPRSGCVSGDPPLRGVWELPQPARVFQAEWDTQQARQRQARWERDKGLRRRL